MAALLVGLASASAAWADVIGDCSLTGYTFMGGGSAYTSTPDGPANQRDYFTASSLNWDYNGTNMWGYAWVKFDNLTVSPVAGAHLTFEIFGIGAMGDATPPSEETPAILTVYDPGVIDVADLGGSSNLRSTLRDNLDAAGIVIDTLTMSAGGAYSIDITDLYSAWLADPDSNHGLVFVAPDDGDASRYVGFGSDAGDAPYISSVSASASDLLAGDANRDGVVSAGDYSSVQANFGATGEPGIMGDANGDGVVSAGDYSSVQANFGNTSSAVIPEPATMLLVSVGALSLLIRRKRKG